MLFRSEMLQSTRVVNWNSFLEAMGGAALHEPLEKVVQELTRKGLLFRIPEGLYIPSGLEDVAPRSSAPKKTLEKCLNGYDAGTTRNIREAWNLTTRKDTKAQNLATLCEFLLNEGNRKQIMEALNREEQIGRAHV